MDSQKQENFRGSERKLREKIARYEYTLKNIAYSAFKGDSFEKMAREFAKETLEK